MGEKWKRTSPAIAPLLVGALLLLMSAPAYTAEGALSEVTVCLDPGHGGSAPGAVYDDGTIYLEEADINLDVAFGLRALLEADGAVVWMTRTMDEDKSNSDRYTFCNSKQATILVSVHTNSTTDSNVDGSLALYFHRDDKALAQAIYDVMYPYLRDTSPHPDNFTGFGLDRFASGVLLKSDMPAAMMEPLFMSNPAEAALLATPIYLDGGVTPNPECSGCRRAQIAQTIYDGVLSYFAPGDTNAPPTADFSYTTSGLTASFADASSDPDGEVASWSWDFGDGDTSTEQNPSHAYATGGTYPVRLTVTDNQGATDSTSQDVTVSGSSEGIALTATGYKVRGLQKADLAWSGAMSEKVDVKRDGFVVATIPNEGSHTDNIDQRGGGSYTYQVCEAGTSTCSNEATVTY